jgi:hypothetical protein
LCGRHRNRARKDSDEELTGPLARRVAVQPTEITIRAP